MLTTSVQLGFGAALMLLAGAIYAVPLRRAAPPTHAAVAASMDGAMWPPGWPHEAPDEPLSLPEAHQAMRRHCSCLRDECPRKNAAYLTLVEAGDIRPDASRTR